MAGAKDKILKWLSLKTLPGECVTLAIGAFGGLLFVFLHIPGGSMSGSVVAVALTTTFAQPTQLGGPLRVLALSTMGMAIGSVVGPETFSNMAAYPGTMALMALCVVCMTLASTLVWSWLMGWPPAMALLSSVPGSMSYIVSVSMSLGADAAKVAVVQMSRVIFLVTVLPFIVVWESGGHLGVISHDHADTLYVLIPTLAVRESFRPSASMLTSVNGRGEMVGVRGKQTPVLRLGEHFGATARATRPEDGILIVIESGDAARAILVDELLGKQEVVIKSLGRTFVHQHLVAGGAVLGDGSVGLILDVDTLVRMPSEARARPLSPSTGVPA